VSSNYCTNNTPSRGRRSLKLLGFLIPDHFLPNKRDLEFSSMFSDYSIISVRSSDVSFGKACGSTRLVKATLDESGVANGTKVK